MIPYINLATDIHFWNMSDPKDVRQIGPQEFARRNNYLCRHVETRKNVLDIHGRSEETKFTKWSTRQLEWLVAVCRTKRLKKLIYGDTPQCAVTAKEIAQRYPIEAEKLRLTPFDLGTYSGISHSALRETNPETAAAMERFRYRVASYAESGLPRIAAAEQLSKEITRWHSQWQQVVTEDTLFVLSNSLIVKVANFLQGILPKHRSYRNIGIANAGILDMEKWSPDCPQWPDVTRETLHTTLGDMVIAEFIPKASPYSYAVAIAYPGVFGSSRFGPYNLFNRMARALSSYGILTVVVDPIGSGEALPVHRSSATELKSFAELERRYDAWAKRIVMAHSLSANFLGLFEGFQDARKVLISPILDVHRRRAAWGISGATMTRHGLSFSNDLWEDMSLVKGDARDNVEAFFGSCDNYVDHRLASEFFEPSRVTIIEGAGHNYAEGSTSNILIEKVVESTVSHVW